MIGGHLKTRYHWMLFMIWVPFPVKLYCFVLIKDRGSILGVAWCSY